MCVHPENMPASGIPAGMPLVTLARQHQRGVSLLSEPPWSPTALASVPSVVIHAPLMIAGEGDYHVPCAGIDIGLLFVTRRAFVPYSRERCIGGSNAGCSRGSRH